MNHTPVPLLFEASRPGRRCTRYTGADRAKATAGLPAGELRDTPPALPEMAEQDLLRHFTILSQKNYAISTQFYPLGSCTMKYNPQVNEAIAAQPAWAHLHPLQEAGEIQGALKLMHQLQADLAAKKIELHSPSATIWSLTANLT